MDIEENIYEQYRDTPFKIEDKSKNQQNSEENDKDLQNFKKSEEYNKFLKNVNELLKEPNGRRISDNITLRASIDKSKVYNVQETSFVNNDNTIIIGKNESYLNPNENQHKFSIDNNDKRKNISYVNHLYNKEIQNENNNNHNFVQNPINSNKNENKVLYENNIFGGLNNKQNNNMEYENNNNTYYNPFNNNNGQIQQKNELSNNNKTDYEDNDIKIPNIILTTIKDDEINKNTSKKFSFFNIFGRNKDKDKKIDKQENINNLINNNELETIDQKLRTEPKDININNDTTNKNNNINNTNNMKQNILLKKVNQNDIDEEDDDILNSYNFILTSRQEPIDDKKIDILKKDLESKEEIIEYNDINNNNNIANPIQLSNEKNEPYIDNQNIFGNNKSNENPDENKKYFYLKAEPIENNNQINNEEEENNLGTSSEIIDFDKNSEYTIQTGTNFDHIIKKKSKWCPYLLLALLGVGGLMFLLYKSKKLREIIINLLKEIPNFFKGLFGIFGKDVDDFLEKYNDSYRLLGDILIILGIWIVFRLLMNFLKKLLKKKN